MQRVWSLRSSQFRHGNRTLVLPFFVATVIGILMSVAAVSFFQYNLWENKVMDTRVNHSSYNSQSNGFCVVLAALELVDNPNPVLEPQTGTRPSSHCSLCIVTPHRLR